MDDIIIFIYQKSRLSRIKILTKLIMYYCVSKYNNEITQAYDFNVLTNVVL